MASLNVNRQHQMRHRPVAVIAVSCNLLAIIIAFSVDRKKDIRFSWYLQLDEMSSASSSARKFPEYFGFETDFALIGEPFGFYRGNVLVEVFPLATHSSKLCVARGTTVLSSRLYY